MAGEAKVNETRVLSYRVDMRVEGITLSDFATTFDRGWENGLSRLNAKTRELVVHLGNKTSVHEIRIEHNNVHVSVECGARHISNIVRNLLNAELKTYVPPNPIRLRDLFDLKFFSDRR